MPLVIAILEDNSERWTAMQPLLQDRFHQFEIRCFGASLEMIEFLRQRLPEVIAISLDHDLELLPGENGRTIDPGTGREVTSFLAEQKPVCPVIIHTTNTVAAVGMEMDLQDAGWKTLRVIPMNDTEWIADDWFPVIRRVVVDSALPQGAVGASPTLPKDQ